MSSFSSLPEDSHSSSAPWPAAPPHSLRAILPVSRLFSVPQNPANLLFPAMTADPSLLEFCDFYLTINL